MPFYRISDMEAVRASVGPATAKTAPGEMNIELQFEDYHYLRTLEEVKKQYRQYVEVSELYKLPIWKEPKPVKFQPPSPEHPLTTNTFQAK